MKEIIIKKLRQKQWETPIALWYNADPRNKKYWQICFGLKSKTNVMLTISKTWQDCHWWYGQIPIGSTGIGIP